MRPYKILVFGFPRSGTKYMAHGLTLIGLEVGHETIEADGGSGYVFAKNDLPTGPNSGHWRPPLGHFEIVCHVFRDPRYVIPSAEANLPGLEGWTDMQVAWVTWNHYCRFTLRRAAVEGCKILTTKIEDADLALWEIAGMLKIDAKASDFDSLPKTTNHRKDYQRIEWDGLSGDVRQMAAEYGYDVPTKGDR